MDTGEQRGVEGPLDELLEEEEGRLLDDVSELKDGVREFDGEGGSADVAGLLERCARLSFLGVCVDGRGTI